MFQPTHPHGVRPFLGMLCPELIGFNPRTRTGCDVVAKSDRLARDMFQPTHPHGVRRELRRTLPKLSWRFNPRTRTGCDFEESRDAITLLSFNPRTRTGCDDIETTGLKPYNKVSTHAPARGATIL